MPRRKTAVSITDAPRLARAFTAQLLSVRVMHLSTLDAEQFKKTMDAISTAMMDAWWDGFLTGRK